MYCIFYKLTWDDLRVLFPTFSETLAVLVDFFSQVTVMPTTNIAAMICEQRWLTEQEHDSRGNNCTPCKLPLVKTIEIANWPDPYVELAIPSTTTPQHEKVTQAYSEFRPSSKMEFFVKIVNDFQLLFFYKKLHLRWLLGSEYVLWVTFRSKRQYK